VLLLFYILVTVAGHSDIELIRPDTQISLDKVSLPAGWVLTPFLQLKLSVFWFYALAPLVVLALHFELLRLRPDADEPWASALRVAGNVLAPMTLFFLLWKFAPYAHSRPPEIASIVSGGRALSYFHAAALFLDGALLLYANLGPSTETSGVLFGRAHAWQRAELVLIAVQQAGLLWLLVICIAGLIQILATLDQELTSSATTLISTSTMFRSVKGFSDSSIIIGSAILIGVVAWAVLAVFWHVSKTRSLAVSGEAAPFREVAPMFIYSLLLGVLLVGIALPDLGRPLNLVGARLAAAEPSDSIIAALIGTAPSNPDKARRDAWQHFGRGLDYRKWRFANASFDDAVMPLVHLDYAYLTDASLVRADLSLASLVGTDISRAALVEADLRGANLTCLNDRNPQPCSLFAQAPNPIPFGNLLTPLGVCSSGATGPKLNNALFSEATLERANLSKASLRGANFRNVRTLKDSVFVGADLRNADLNGVKFEGVDLGQACLCGADLRNADLSLVRNLKGAILRDADLSNATLPFALQGINFEGANIKDTHFADKSNLSEANLNGVVQQQREPPGCSLQ
jgi:Pentapeptide repeats (8 copies)